MSKTAAVVLVLVSVLFGTAGQILAGYNLAVLGAAAATLSFSAAAIAKAPQLAATGQDGSKAIILALLISAAIMKVASQILTGYGKAPIGAPIAALAVALATVAQTGDLLKLAPAVPPQS